MAITPNSLNMKKQTPNIASPSSQDILIRETLRISAELASTPLLDTTTISPPLESTSTSTVRFICCEEIDGRRWKYVADTDASGQFKTNSFRSLSLQTPKPPLDELMAFVRSYVVPEGFPDSVTPSYVPYMTWRALKVIIHLFNFRYRLLIIYFILYSFLIIIIDFYFSTFLVELWVFSLLKPF